MLLKRIITASVLATLIALAVFKIPMEYFSLLIGLITLLAAWEWSYLIGITSPTKRILFLNVICNGIQLIIAVFFG